MSKPYKDGDEKPIARKHPLDYNRGAKPASREPLAKDSNYSTGDSNMTTQKQEAHRQALETERNHLSQIYPFKKPKRKW